jgi:DNA-binding Lrp family transcriptional regulator
MYVTPTEKEILSHIDEENSITQSEIWKDTEMSQSAVSDAVNSLEKRGLVKCEEVSVDGFSTKKISLAQDNYSEVDYNVLMAGEMLPPFISDDKVSPEDEYMTEWILHMISEEEEKIDDE